MATEPIIVREAQADDGPFLRAMIWEALLASPVFLSHLGVEAIQRHEAQYWSGWTAHPDPAFIAVDENGRKLGAILLKPSGPDRPAAGWRISMGLEANARGQGIGRRLIERAVEFARADGKRYVNLLVDPTNTRAIALYRRTGFVDVGTRDGVIEMRISFDP
jgi:ribosomal protein S18 acetylase RimI-like enzyme